ncbi:hypothetical protein CLV47_10788 [Antricoccus suffuscus]|uniref:Uncharacterized protein n=1 Tax=Antricoccus suffuscus TaxID=1629062 RepID=A0A2T1A038_9ACTN|nr:hypothetical protein [Antricoccus suffuscus]PRZ41960.1 hypothetical protein CLV47_10788 [Antricoccus suffuscus]
MNMNERLAGISMPRKIVAGAGVVLLINSFLPWYHISIGGFGGASASGWHGLGVITWLLVIGLLAIEGARAGGVLPLNDGQAELASLAASAGAVVFGLIYVIVRLSDGHLGFGFYIGILALAGLAYGALRLFQAGAAMTALKGLQSSTESD